MYYLIVYSSITFANSIKKYFINDGDYVGVVHTPSELSKGGCSYSVKIKPHKLEEVIEVSERFGFKIKAVYSQTNDGKYILINI